MSEKNNTITTTGLRRMLVQFDGSPKLRALASAFLDRVQDFEDAYHPLLAERDLNQATGHRLDGFGQIVRLTRGGLTDADYRRRLLAEFAILRSQGLTEDVLSVAQLLIDMATADYELVEYYPKTVYIRPVDHALTQDPAFIAGALRRTVSAGTRLLFVYALRGDADLFTLSTVGATLQTSSTLGLASVPSAGGNWQYDATSTVLAGVASGFFRFNHADPAQATELYVHDENSAASDESAFLGGLADSVLLIRRAAGIGTSVNMYVTSATDNTGTFTLAIEPQQYIGPLLDANSYGLYGFDDGGMLVHTA